MNTTLFFGQTICASRNFDIENQEFDSEDIDTFYLTVLN